MTGGGWWFRLKGRVSPMAALRAAQRRSSRGSSQSARPRETVPQRLRIHVFSWREEYVSAVAASVSDDGLAVQISGCDELQRLLATLLELRSDPAFSVFLWSRRAGFELVTWGESSDWLLARSVRQVLVRYPHWLSVRQGHLHAAGAKQAQR